MQALTELLSGPPIGPAFGARDVWQVIDQVNANELGGAANVARYHTQAQAGAAILNWLVLLRKPITGKAGCTAAGARLCLTTLDA